LGAAAWRDLAAPGEARQRGRAGGGDGGALAELRGRQPDPREQDLPDRWVPRDLFQRRPRDAESRRLPVPARPASRHLRRGRVEARHRARVAEAPGGRAPRGVMEAKAREKALERARSLEKAGQGDAAAKLFREAGAVEEAARVLGTLRRPRDAAQLLIESLGVPPGQAGRLDPAGKKRALMAAIFLGRAGDNQQAVQLFMALGEQQRAVELLQKAGDTVGAAKLAAMKPGQFEAGPMLAPAKATAIGGQAVSMATAQKLEESGKLEAALQSYVSLKRFADAGRCAKALGRKADAAQLFADAGIPFEAAQAYLELGDTGKALENLCRVPAE